MKTIINWFELLPESIKTEAINNSLTQNRVNINTKEVDTLKDALNEAFTWGDTSEGELYWISIHTQLNEYDNILQTPLVFSSSMRTMLVGMRSINNVAGILLCKNRTNIKFGNYITMRGDLCSYLPNGREHVVNENNKWARTNRQDIKIIKLAKALINESELSVLDSSEFEKFNNLVKSYISVIGDEEGEGKKIALKVINGEEIKAAYLESNYSGILGTDTNLYNSCMRYEQCQNYLKIYTQNPDNVSLLVAHDNNGKVIGRAILWLMDDGKKAMDTIYAHESITQSFIKWAHDNNHYYKSKQSCHHDDFDRHLTDGAIGKLIVTLKKYRFEEYPYMDTLSILEGNELRNANTVSEYKVLKNIDGGFDQNESLYDVFNECNIDEDDARYVNYTRPNGRNIEGHINIDDLSSVRNEWVLDEDCVDVDGENYLKNDDNIYYIESRDAYFTIDDCVTTYDYQTIHIDDSVNLCEGVYDEDYAHEDDAKKCAFDGEYYINEDMIEINGDMIFKGNLAEYQSNLENTNTENNEIQTT